MSLKFLNLKSFHPGNKNSQKKLFIAEEREKQLKKREDERAKEVLTEQEFIKNRALLSGSKLEAERSKVSFLYTLPPGAVDEKQQQQQQKNDKDLKDFEKFPILANAPTDGVISSETKLVHKPLGILINNVKCARCHNWGHRSGDRECPLVDSNPNEYKNLQMNDPMNNSYNSNSNNNHFHNNNNNNNSNNNNINYYNEHDNQDNRKRFRLNSSASSPKSFGRDSNNYSVVEDVVDNNHGDEEEDDDDDDQVEREFLASLTKKQRKLLLKQIKLEEKQAKKKKKKREKRKYSDSSDTDSDRDRKKRHKSSSSRKKEKKNSNDDYEEKSHN
ncbi:hypothetical protein ACTFIU_001089 [Dictyostelium citrinum]